MAARKIGGRREIARLLRRAAWRALEVYAYGCVLSPVLWGDIIRASDTRGVAEPALSIWREVLPPRAACNMQRAAMLALLVAAAIEAGDLP